MMGKQDLKETVHKALLKVGVEKINNIGENDNFFTHNILDSMQTMQFILYLEELIETQIPYDQLTPEAISTINETVKTLQKVTGKG